MKKEVKVGDITTTEEPYSISWQEGNNFQVLYREMPVTKGVLSPSVAQNVVESMNLLSKSILCLL